MNAKEFLILNRPEQGLEIHIGVDVTDYRTDWHFHEEWQVVQVLSGARVFEWRSGSHVVSAGQTLVIPPGCVHRGEGGRASFRMFYVAPGGDVKTSVPACTSRVGSAG
jgi:quercetin dioxygenase-like cupin family protein